MSGPGLPAGSARREISLAGVPAICRSPAPLSRVGCVSIHAAAQALIVGALLLAGNAFAVSASLRNDGIE